MGGPGVPGLAAAGRVGLPAQLHGRVTAAYAATAYDDAVKAVAGGQQKLATAVPPDAATTALRDRLAPLVVAAAAELSEANGADTDAALADAVDALNGTAERLNDLIEENQ